LLSSKQVCGTPHTYFGTGHLPASAFTQLFRHFFPLEVLISAAIYKAENTTRLGLKGEVEALKINI